MGRCRRRWSQRRLEPSADRPALRRCCPPVDPVLLHRQSGSVTALDLEWAPSADRPRLSALLIDVLVAGRKENGRVLACAGPTAFQVEQPALSGAGGGCPHDAS